jgi:hypothetical protein
VFWPSRCVLLLRRLVDQPGAPTVKRVVEHDCSSSELSNMPLWRSSPASAIPELTKMQLRSSLECLHSSAIFSCVITGRLLAGGADHFHDMSMPAKKSLSVLARHGHHISIVLSVSLT